MTCKFKDVLIVVIYLIFASFNSYSWAEDEVTVANQVINIKDLYLQPEVFLVKVTKVNTLNNYCTALVNGRISYIEPLESDTCRLNSEYQPLKLGEYYLMSLVYSNPDLCLYPVNTQDVLVGNVNGQRVTIYDVMNVVPDTFICVNMAGISIRQIQDGDLDKRDKWPLFQFHFGIPSISSIIGDIKAGNSFSYSTLKVQNLMSKIDTEGMVEMMNRNKTKPIPKELPIIRRPQKEQ